MIVLKRLWLVAIVVVSFAVGTGAHADNVIARWIQLAPGSKLAHPKTTNFGDNPLSLTPTILARAIVSDYPNQGCPSVTVDHHMNARQMMRRFDGSTLTNVPGGGVGATNAAAGYPQYFINAGTTAGTTLPGVNGGPAATTSWTECETIIPPGHRVATIDGVDLRLPVASPKRILVMADTGCRLKGTAQQDCQNAAYFPLQFLSSFEATFKPDLIVQVGDWFYRDTNCLVNGAEAFTGCTNLNSDGYETWGDTFDSWNADLFFPARDLLASAPWIMVRGNHESCGRGARGWFALLDPHPYNFSHVACQRTTAYPAPGGTADTPVATYTDDFEQTYVVPVNNVNFLVHDSSFANDSAVDANMAKNYEIDLTNALAAVGPNSINIFTTHKPTFGLGTGFATTSDTTVTDDFGDFTEQATFFSGGSYTGSAFASGVPATIGLFLSGHVHQLEYMNFSDAAHYPPQLVVGTGGDLLDADTRTGKTPSGLTYAKPFVQDGTKDGNTYQYKVHQYTSTTTATAQRNVSQDEFGFAVLDAVNDANGNTTSYSAHFYKISSNRSGHCTITLGNAPSTTRGLACNF